MTHDPFFYTITNERSLGRKNSQKPRVRVWSGQKNLRPAQVEPPHQSRHTQTYVPACKTGG